MSNHLTPEELFQRREKELATLDEARFAEARRKRREKQLLEEFDFIAQYRVVLESPDGRKNASFRIEELFEMFELVRERNEHQS